MKLSGSGGAVRKLGVSAQDLAHGMGAEAAVDRFRPTLKLVDAGAANGVVNAWSLRRQQSASRTRGFTGDPSAKARCSLESSTLRRATPPLVSRARGIGRPGVLGSLPALARVLIARVSVNCSAGIARALCVGHGPHFMLKSRGRVATIRSCGVPAGRVRVTAG
jgi:hypothetical protein